MILHKGLIILAITLSSVLTLNSLLFVGESETADSNATYLTYNDTAYGISIDYPYNWQFVEPPADAVLSLLLNMSNAESQGKVILKDDKTSIVLDVLNAFGLDKVSDILGLKAEDRTEILQKMSQALNNGTVQLIAGFVSPPENELDIYPENMNIVIENISSQVPISLNDYVSANIEGLKVLFPRFSMIEPIKEIVVDGHPAISFIYTDSVTNGEKILQVYTIRGERGYILTFGVTTDTYSMYLPIFNKMLESVEISD